VDEVFRDLSKVSDERCEKAAYLIRDSVKRHLRRQIGTGKTTGISRPIYKTGRYAGQPWTARDPSELMKSIRVVQKKEQYGTEIIKLKDYRVYAGNYLAYYASIFEANKPFMRPAVEETLSEVRRILGVV